MKALQTFRIFSSIVFSFLLAWLNPLFGQRFNAELFPRLISLYETKQYEALKALANQEGFALSKTMPNYFEGRVVYVGQYTFKREVQKDDFLLGPYSYEWDFKTEQSKMDDFTNRDSLIVENISFEYFVDKAFKSSFNIDHFVNFLKSNYKTDTVISPYKEDEFMLIHNNKPGEPYFLRLYVASTELGNKKDFTSVRFTFEKRYFTFKNKSKTKKIAKSIQ